jgi:ATP-dependent DNA ligase
MQFYAFDLLYMDGFDLRASRLVERKHLLDGCCRAASLRTR